MIVLITKIVCLPIDFLREGKLIDPSLASWQIGMLCFQKEVDNGQGDQRWTRSISEQLTRHKATTESVSEPKTV